MDHINHLKAVFDHLGKVALMLNPKKCQVMYVWWGWVSWIPHGLKPNNRNINVFKSFLLRTNLKQLQKFLGLTSCFHHFIPGYAEIVYPLHGLIRKGALFEWSADCEAALETLKTKLLTSPVLAYPDFNKDFHIRDRCKQACTRCHLVTIQRGSTTASSSTQKSQSVSILCNYRLKDISCCVGSHTFPTTYSIWA